MYRSNSYERAIRLTTTEGQPDLLVYLNPALAHLSCLLHGEYAEPDVALDELSGEVDVVGDGGLKVEKRDARTGKVSKVV